MVVILHGALHQGATLVTLSRFELNQFLQTLEEYRVTVAHLVPPIILALAKHPSVEGRDFSTLRLIFSGAAPLDADLIRACSERIGCVVTQGFGMTETAPVTHCNTSGEPVGSVGRLLPNTESMVLAVGTEKALPPGETGEIAVRGPQVMKGYLHQPEATAAMIDQKGWLHTGDLGYADAEGNFYVVDRLKELIKYKAYQVAPAELEAVLLSHPMVADAAVVRSPDLEAGEVPKAFVVLRGEVASEELLDYVAERVAPHKKIRRLEVVDSIPKSPSGKILRRVLMEREWAPVG
jgi:acyl-CoA synthetase (AMP-forming)/AMP-acid ligase II